MSHHGLGKGGGGGGGHHGGGGGQHHGGGHHGGHHGGGHGRRGWGRRGWGWGGGWYGWPGYVDYYDPCADLPYGSPAYRACLLYGFVPNGLYGLGQTDEELRQRAIAAHAAATPSVTGPTGVLRTMTGATIGGMLALGLTGAGIYWLMRRGSRRRRTT